MRGELGIGAVVALVVTLWFAVGRGTPWYLGAGVGVVAGALVFSALRSGNYLRRPPGAPPDPP